MARKIYFYIKESLLWKTKYTVSGQYIRDSFVSKMEILNGEGPRGKSNCGLRLTGLQRAARSTALRFLLHTLYSKYYPLLMYFLVTEKILTAVTGTDQAPAGLAAFHWMLLLQIRGAISKIELNLSLLLM